MSVLSKDQSAFVVRAKQRKQATQERTRVGKPQDIKPLKYVVSIPLVVNAREQRILNAQYRAVGKLRNATLGTLLSRVEQMRRDSRWSAASYITNKKQRQLEYNSLYQQYQVSLSETSKAAHKHFNNSQWMSNVFGSRVVNGLVPEIWNSVDAWIRQTRPGTGKPNFQLSADNNIMHGNENKAHLHLKIHGGVACIRLRSRTKRKTLLLDLPKTWQPGSLNWERKLAQPLANGKVKRVSLKREIVRGRQRYFAMIVIEGLPYRNYDYIEQTLVVHGKHVGLDVGPSTLALVGEKSSMLLDLYPEAVKEERKQEQQQARCAQRALDRSLRISNPESYDKQGRSIKERKKTNRSKKYKRVQAKLNTVQRKRKIHKQQDHVRIARTVMRTMGTHISSERNSYAGWQAGWFGKRMLETSPGMLMDRLHSEARLLHAIHDKNGYGPVSTTGSYEFETNSDCAPSQHCLCGHKQKKDLSARHHACTACGLGLPLPSTHLPLADSSHKLDRDLFSALLARLVSENQDKQGHNILSNGPYADYAYKDGNRARVRELTSARTPVTTPSLYSLPLVEEERKARGSTSVDFLDDHKLSMSSVVVEMQGQTPEQHETPPQLRIYNPTGKFTRIGRARTLLKATYRIQTSASRKKYVPYYHP